MTLRHFGIQGVIPPTVQKPAKYFTQRNIHLDCRGPVTIHGTSDWGSNIDVITAGHRPAATDREWDVTVYRPVVVGAHARISNSVVLYNCTIGDGAIVAAGAVVRSRDVPAWTIVEGNPVQIIAKFNHSTRKWEYLREDIPIRRKK